MTGWHSIGASTRRLTACQSEQLPAHLPVRRRQLRALTVANIGRCSSATRTVPRIVWQTDGNDLSANRAFNDAQWHVIAAQFDAAAPSDKQLSVDGIAVGTVDVHAGTIGGALRFGLVGAATTASVFDGVPAGAFFAGDLAELVVFDRALDADEQPQMERYFARRYG